MPATDGTITSRDICNQAVVERAIKDASIVSLKLAADLQSDTWDGTTVAAGDATAGWRIERNTGNLGIGAAYVRGALSAATISADDITAGTLSAGVIYGGTIRAKDVFVGSYDNLISDPDFQFTGDVTGDGGGVYASGVEAWIDATGNGLWEIDTTISRSGEYSVLLDTTTQAAQESLYATGSVVGVNAQRANPSVSEGDQLYAETWVRAGAAGSCNRARIIILWRSSADASLAFSVGDWVTPTTTWAKLSKSGTAPADTSYAIIYVNVENTGHVNNVHFDNFYARRMLEGSIIVDGSIEANHIAANTITVTEISPTAGITGGQIATTTITGGNIDTGTITASNIVAGTITGTEIAPVTITAANIVAGTITNAQIQGGTITNAEIASGTITSANIQNGTITGTDIGSATITASNIVAGTITGTLIDDATITNAKLISVSGDIISAGTITGSTIRTASSNQRVQMDATAHDLQFFGSNGVKHSTIDGITNSKLYMTLTDGLYIDYDTGNSFYVDGANNRVTSTHPYHAADGSVSAPTFAFTNDSNTGMYRATTDHLGFTAGGTDRLNMNTSRIAISLTLRPTDNSFTCGGGSNRFTDIYATSGSVNTSDLSVKKQVSSLTKHLNAAEFVDAINPIRFKWKGGGKRFHYGFDMDTIEAAVTKFGDFGGYIDPSINPDLPEDAQGPKGLRTIQLIPVLWAAVQQLQARIAVLEAP